MTPTSRIEINQDHLRHNLSVIRRALRHQEQLIGVVKANAYGHGLTTMLRLLEEEVDAYQVDDIEELTQVRLVSSKPTLVLGYVSPAETPVILEQGGIVSCLDLEHCEALETSAAKLGRRLPIVIAVDTGMGREGCHPSDFPTVLKRVRSSPHLVLVGAYSHFSSSDDFSPFGRALTRSQSETMTQTLHSLRDGSSLLHVANSAGVASGYSLAPLCNAVRIGIAIYGLLPSAECKASLLGLRPIARWVSHVAQVKTLPPKHSLGYGATFWTYKPTTVALIPQGYSDGLSRHLSNRGAVLIQGSRCPLVGRISMNMCVADISHLHNVQRGDEVVLLGSQGSIAVTAEERAQQLGTINYEIMTTLSPLLPRQVVP